MRLLQIFNETRVPRLIVKELRRKYVGKEIPIMGDRGEGD